MALRLWALSLAAALAGCGSVPAGINPVTWWHDLQGGAIAEQRPPPPGATDPYPNLASVPDRPPPLDPATRQAIAQGLVADRANAQHDAAAAPLPDPSSRTESPGLFGGASRPPGAASTGTATGPSASFAAASAPPALPAAASGQQPQGSPPRIGAPPPLPTAPPPPANLPGASPPSPPPARPPLPPAGSPPPAGGVSVPFAPGAASLSPEAGAVLHAIAVQRRETTAVVVTGHGETAGSDPAAQAAALTLALARAQAIARALTAEGVPAGAVVTDAQAEGRGAAVRLIN